jgi:hypothetical protein
MATYECDLKRRGIMTPVNKKTFREQTEAAFEETLKAKREEEKRIKNLVLEGEFLRSQRVWNVK